LDQARLAIGSELFLGIGTRTWGYVVDLVGPNRFVYPEFLGDNVQVRSPCEGLDILGVRCIFLPHGEQDKLPESVAQRDASTVNATVHVRSSLGSFIGA
jgi:hypothetical protein